MRFAIGSVHRAGSNYLAYVLNEATDSTWHIQGEDFDIIPALANNTDVKIQNGIVTGKPHKL